MLTSIVCHCLTYDARVMPCSLVLPHAQIVEQAIMQTLHVIIGIGDNSLTTVNAHRRACPRGTVVSRSTYPHKPASSREQLPSLSMGLHSELPYADAYRTPMPST